MPLVKEGPTITRIATGVTRVEGLRLPAVPPRKEPRDEHQRLVILRLIRTVRRPATPVATTGPER